MKRLLKFLTLKNLALPTAKITKLADQGLSGQVYSLDSDREHFILKFYRERDDKKITRIMETYRYLTDSGVPVPEVYIADGKGRVTKKPFILMQKLKEEKFSSLLKRRKEKDFINALALSLHRLHSVDIGGLDANLREKRFEDEIRDIKILAEVLLAFSVSPIVFRRLYKALSAISNSNVQGNPSALLHGDCGPDNIIYSNGTAYLIDLDDAYIGDPAFDLGYAYHCIKLSAPTKPELAEDFIEAYENLYGKVAALDTYKRLVALKLAISLRFLTRPNLLMVLLAGFKRTINLVALSKQFSRFIEYCLTYAERQSG